MARVWFPANVPNVAYHHWSAGAALATVPLIILFLFLNRGAVTSLLPPRIAQGVLVATTLFSLGLQYHTLKHLPIVDCLAYKVGNNLPQQMKIPAGSIPDSTVINFVYEHQGREVEFDADHFPANFTDSGYTFKKRYDKLVRKGNAEPPVKDFIIITPSGNDTTMALLSGPGYCLILFGQGLYPQADLASWGRDLKNIHKRAQEKGVPLYVVSSRTEEAAQALKRSGIDLPVFRGDAVAIKTAARANPVIYLLKGGTVMGKWAYADFEQVELRLDHLP